LSNWIKKLGGGMSFDKSRRDFLGKDLKRAVTSLIGDVLCRPPEETITTPDYFQSFETCYPLLSEAGELLTEEAARMGIDTREKSRLEIAREVFSRCPTRPNKEGS